MKLSPEGIPLRGWFKCRVLLFLNRRLQLSKSDNASYSRWLSIKDIAAGAGVSQGSARVLLARWAKHSNAWGYVNSYKIRPTSDGRPHVFYAINRNGLRYMRKLPNWYSFYKNAQSFLDARPFKGRTITPKPVYFPLLAGQATGIVLNWPFQLPGDVSVFRGRSVDESKAFVCSDLNDAILRVRIVYGLSLNVPVQQAAIRLVKETAGELGYRARITPVR